MNAMNILIGIIALAAAVYLYKQLTQWWVERERRKFVERTLRPYGGLDHPIASPSVDPKDAPSQRLV